MKRYILALLIAAVLPNLCYAQYEKISGRVNMFTVTSVQPYWGGGGPCVIRFFSYEGENVVFSLIVTSTISFDESLRIDIGGSVEESLEWFEKMELLCTAPVGSHFAIGDVGYFENLGRTYRVMVGDRTFSGIGEMDEPGSSLVFYPDDGEKRYGVYGVRQSTFKKLRKKLAKVAKEKGLK